MTPKSEILMSHLHCGIEPHLQLTLRILLEHLLECLLEESRGEAIRHHDMT